MRPRFSVMISTSAPLPPVVGVSPAFVHSGADLGPRADLGNAPWTATALVKIVDQVGRTGPIKVTWGGPGRTRRRRRPPGRGRAGRACAAAADVRLHRRLGQRPAGGDLRVGQPARHQAQHLALAVGQLVEPATSAARAGRRPGRSGEPVEQPTGHGGGEQRVAARDHPDRRDQLGRPDVLEQEAAGAGPQRREHVLVEVVGGEHDDPGRLPERDDAPGRLDPVEPSASGRPSARRRARCRRTSVDAPRRRRRPRRRPRCRAARRGSSGSPLRTSAWSSTTSTRMAGSPAGLVMVAPSWVGRLASDPVTARSRTGRSRGCRLTCRALLHPDDSVAPWPAVTADASAVRRRSRCRRRRRRARPLRPLKVIVTSDPFRACVAERIRQRLLHDAVGRHVDAGRQRASLADARRSSPPGRRPAAARRARRPGPGRAADAAGPSAAPGRTAATAGGARPAPPGRWSRSTASAWRAWSGRVSKTSSAAAACTTITETLWATTSCISRAIRARSSATARLVSCSIATRRFRATSPNAQATTAMAMVK